jgi:hypothetical protein
VRGFSLAENKNVCQMRRDCGGTERRDKILSAMRRIGERTSIGNITSPSPGPPAARKRPRGSPSPQREGFLTGILRGENEKAKPAALLPYRGIEVLEWAGLCFHQHSRFVRWFSLNPHDVRVGLALPSSGRRKCGDGKPSPYNGLVIDGLGATQALTR